MIKQGKNHKKVKGSALLSSVLVLITTLVFIQMYQSIYITSMENNRIIIKKLVE